MALHQSKKGAPRHRRPSFLDPLLKMCATPRRAGARTSMREKKQWKKCKSYGTQENTTSPTAWPGPPMAGTWPSEMTRVRIHRFKCGAWRAKRWASSSPTSATRAK